MNTVVALAAICLLALLVSGAPSNKDTDQKWEQYKQKYSKVYKAHDEKMRKAVFVKNLQKIQEHNKQHAAGKETYTLGINQFSDLTYEEFALQHLGTKLKKNVLASTEVHQDELDKVLGAVGIPATVDWVTAGAVTPVKNQEQCGSCWAFSATGSIEGQYAIQKKQKVDLSEQQLVDCSSSYGNNGCYGGLYFYAFEYIKANGGIDSEASYPYQGVNGQCNYQSSESAATVTGYVQLPENNEQALTNAIATVGPISVAILATDNLQSYTGGVLNDKLCANIGTAINHGVLAVGYGVDSTGGPYFLVKNSWGPGWGLQGYFKLARNGKNMCNIAYIPGYPLV